MTTIEKREIPVTGILQEWVAKLGLRHQGVLLTAIRGCDIAPRQDPSKDVSRALRGAILNTHAKDPKESKSFIEFCGPEELLNRLNKLLENFDHYPHHFIMHLIHSIEIIGYYHPDQSLRSIWFAFYVSFCNKLHMDFEMKEQLDKRLNAEENKFKDSQ